MLLQYDYQFRVTNYMNLTDKIKMAKNDLLEMRHTFEAINKYTSSIIDEELGQLYTQGFRISDEVCDFVTAEEKCKNRIEKMEYRQKHFKAFLETLTESEAEYMNKVYKHEEGRFIDMNNGLEARIQTTVSIIEKDASELFGTHDSRDIGYIEVPDEDHSLEEESISELEELFLSTF